MAKPKRDQLSFPPVPTRLASSAVAPELPIGPYSTKRLRQVRDELIVQEAVTTAVRMKGTHIEAEQQRLEHDTGYQETETIEALQALKNQPGRDEETQYLVEQAINRALHRNHLATDEIATAATEAMRRVQDRSLYPERDARSLKEKLGF